MRLLLPSTCASRYKLRRLPANDRLARLSVHRNNLMCVIRKSKHRVNNQKKYHGLLTLLPCPSSRGRLLVIPMTISLQVSRSLVSPHSSVSVQFVMAFMSSSHRARGMPLFLAPLALLGKRMHLLFCILL